MKRSMFFGILIVLTLGTVLGATPIIEFSPGPVYAGDWEYDGSLGVLSFKRDILVDRAHESSFDALVGACVMIPDLYVTGSGGVYSLTPVLSNHFEIRSSSGDLYLQADLDSGNLLTVGTVAGAYTVFRPDLTNLTITTVGRNLNSNALNAILNSGVSWLDFDLSLQGGRSDQYYSFQEIIDHDFSGKGGFSGSIGMDRIPVTPIPGSLILAGLGILLIGQIRRQGMRIYKDR